MTKGGLIMVIKMGNVKLLDVEEISKILPITPLTIREYLKKGKIPGGKKIGKNWYVSRNDLKAYLSGENDQ